MAKGDKDFLEFQKEFKKYQRLFGLTGYKVYFSYEPLGHCFASITVEQETMVATVKLNSDNGEHEHYKDIKRSAKHEAIHLMLNRIEHRARSRYTSEEDIYESSEELVFKLEELIPDLR